MEKVNIQNEYQSISDVLIGENVRFFKFVNAYGCEIDDNSKVGAFVEIQRGQL